MTIKAIPIGEFDFSPYGTYYNLKEDAERVSHTKTEVYEEDCDMLLRVREPGAIRGSIVGEWASWSLEGSAVPASPADRGPRAELNMAGK